MFASFCPAAGLVVLLLRFGSVALWMAVWLVRTLYASASHRSRIVCNGFWDLSRRERCLDKSQKPLRAAWIGVMQKDWMKEGHCREVRLCSREAVSQSSVSLLGESGGCG